MLKFYMITVANKPSYWDDKIIVYNASFNTESLEWVLAYSRERILLLLYLCTDINVEREDHWCPGGTACSRHRWSGRGQVILVLTVRGDRLFLIWMGWGGGLMMGGGTISSMTGRRHKCKILSFGCFGPGASPIGSSWLPRTHFISFKSPLFTAINEMLLHFLSVQEVT